MSKKRNSVYEEIQQQNEEIQQQNESNRKKRIEEAKKIASKSQEIIDDNYNAIAYRILKILRGINKRLDFILTNSFSAKVVSLILAIMLYISINYSGDINVFGENNVGRNMYGVPVKVIYDSDKYQVENVPEYVDLTIVGNVEAIRRTDVLNQYEVIADLTNYKAGMNQQVQLLYSGIADGVHVTFSQATFEVDIFDRVSKSFSISPVLIRVPVNTKYNYDVQLEFDKIEIRAAQHTLDKITSLKALVDVHGKTKDYTTEAIIAAYDNDGNKIEGIIQEKDKIEVSVKVSKK